MQLCVSCNHLHTTISQPSHTWGAEGGETDQAVWGGVGLEDGALEGVGLEDGALEGVGVAAAWAGEGREALGMAEVEGFC